MKEYLRKIQTRVFSVDPTRIISLEDVADPIINNIPGSIKLVNKTGQVFQISIQAYHPELCNRYRAQQIGDIGTLSILDRSKEELFKLSKIIL